MDLSLKDIVNSYAGTKITSSIHKEAPATVRLEQALSDLELHRAKEPTTTDLLNLANGFLNEKGEVLNFSNLNRQSGQLAAAVVERVEPSKETIHDGTELYQAKPTMIAARLLMALGNLKAFMAKHCEIPSVQDIIEKLANLVPEDSPIQKFLLRQPTTEPTTV